MNEDVQLDEYDIRVRYMINRFFVAEGTAPSVRDLGRLCKCTTRQVELSIRRLVETDLITLFPGTDRIWAAHPFSSVPSSYWVESEGKGWWGNCGYCALGIAAMQLGSTVIHSRLGAQQESVEIHTSSRGIEPPDLLLHIPLPIAQWHDCLPFTCSNVHYFRSESDIDLWADRKRLPRGRAIRLDRAWTLALAWYGNYLDSAWKPRSEGEINDLLQSCGLDGSFWLFPQS